MVSGAPVWQWETIEEWAAGSGRVGPQVEPIDATIILPSAGAGVLDRIAQSWRGRAYYLAGGTGMAIKLSHRVSRDLGADAWGGPARSGDRWREGHDLVLEVDARTGTESGSVDRFQLVLNAESKALTVAAGAWAGATAAVDKPGPPFSADLVMIQRHE